jgi:hypothetical protein
MVLQHFLASVDDVIRIFLRDESEILVDHTALVGEVGEKEIDLAEIDVVLLIGTFAFFLHNLLQLREIEDAPDEGVEFEIVVLGDEGTEFLHEGEVPVIVDEFPIIILLSLVPSVLKRLKQFLGLLSECLTSEFINLVSEFVDVVHVGGVTFKGYPCVMKIYI